MKRDGVLIRYACRAYGLVLSACWLRDARRFRPQMLQTFGTLCRTRRESASAAAIAVLCLLVAESLNVVLLAMGKRQDRGGLPGGACSMRQRSPTRHLPMLLDDLRADLRIDPIAALRSQ
jgi:hypothetical protein